MNNVHMGAWHFFPYREVVLSLDVKFTKEKGTSKYIICRIVLYRVFLSMSFPIKTLHSSVPIV